MSDIAGKTGAPADATAGWTDLPISLTSFLQTLGPQPQRDAQGRITGFLAGETDEIWSKLLRKRHAAEKHTADEWRRIVDGYRDHPAPVPAPIVVR